MAVFGVIATVLVFAALAQAIRLGVRRGDWWPVGMVLGLVVLCVLYWLWAGHRLGD